MISRARKDRENPYVMVSKQAINDTNLSAKAKGLLVYLLSMPDDWNIYEGELIKHFKDGKEGIGTGLKELIDAGYLRRSFERNEKGQFNGIQYEVFETSSISDTGNLPLSENPFPGKPLTENPTLLINNSTNNDLIDKEKDLKPLPGNETPAKEKSLSRQLTDYFCDKYYKEYGIKYQFEAKDGVLLNSLLKAFGIDFMRDFIDWFFTTDDKFIAQAGRNVGILKASRDKFIASLSKKAQEMELSKKAEEIRRKAEELL
jgi:hypothetical protein